MIDYRFADGTALVTGAASGIGEALAYGWPTAAATWCCSTGTPTGWRPWRPTSGAGIPALRVETVVADLADHVATSRSATAGPRAPGARPW